MSEEPSNNPLDQVLQVCRQWRKLKSRSEDVNLEFRCRIHRILYEHKLGSGFAKQEANPDDDWSFGDLAMELVEAATEVQEAMTIRAAKSFICRAASAMAVRNEVIPLLSESDLQAITTALWQIGFAFDRLKSETGEPGRPSGVTEATKWLCIEIWMASQDRGTINAGIRQLSERFGYTLATATIRRIYNRTDESEYLAEAQATYIALCLIEMEWFAERDIVEELWKCLASVRLLPRAKFMPVTPLPPDADEEMRKRWREYEMRPPASWAFTKVRYSYYRQPITLATSPTPIWEWVNATANSDQASGAKIEAGRQLVRARLGANKHDPCLILTTIVSP